MVPEPLPPLWVVILMYVVVPFGIITAILSYLLIQWLKEKGWIK